MPKRSKVHLVATFPTKKVEAPWTGLQMLKDFVAECEAGKIKPTKTLLFFIDADEGGRFRPHIWCQDISVPDQLAFAALLTSMGLDEWKS